VVVGFRRDIHFSSLLFLLFLTATFLGLRAVPPVTVGSPHRILYRNASGSLGFLFFPSLLPSRNDYFRRHLISFLYLKILRLSCPPNASGKWLAPFFFRPVHPSQEERDSMFFFSRHIFACDPVLIMALFFPPLNFQNGFISSSYPLPEDKLFKNSRALLFSALCGDSRPRLLRFLFPLPYFRPSPPIRSQSQLSTYPLPR